MRNSIRSRLVALAAIALLAAATCTMASVAPAPAGTLPPSTLLTINPVEGKFYEYDACCTPFAGAFDPYFLKSPPFATGTYEAVDFNPVLGSPIVSACDNVPPGFAYDQQIPFTNVSPNGDGSCNFTEVPGAGDTFPEFEATLTGTVTAPARGIYSLEVTGADGWVIGVGTRISGVEKAAPVAGPLVNAPKRTAVNKLPVMAASNISQFPDTYHVLAFFPAAGDYPFEANYVRLDYPETSFTVIPEPVADPNVNVSDISVVYAGDSGTGRSVKVQVTLSRPVDMPVSVDYTISGGTAVNSKTGDYYAKKTTGTLLFKPGPNSGLTPVSKVVSIPTIAPPGGTEDDPYFEVELSNPTGGLTINNSLSTPTIVTTDSTTGPRIGVAPFSTIYSGNGKTRNVIVPVTLSEPQPSDVTVQFDTYDLSAFGGLQYKPISKVVTIKAGRTQANVSIPIFVFDGENSGDFEVVLTNPSGGLALSDAGYGPGVGIVDFCGCSGP